MLLEVAAEYTRPACGNLTLLRQQTLIALTFVKGAQRRQCKDGSSRRDYGVVGDFLSVERNGGRTAYGLWKTWRADGRNGQGGSRFG